MYALAEKDSATSQDEMRSKVARRLLSGQVVCNVQGLYGVI